MALLASSATGGRVDGSVATIVLWGSAAAATLVALTVVADGLGAVAWIAIGYLVYSALLATDRVLGEILVLVLALATVAPRPRRSLALGVVVATVAAFVVREIVGLASAL